MILDTANCSTIANNSAIRNERERERASERARERERHLWKVQKSSVRRRAQQGRRSIQRRARYERETKSKSVRRAWDRDNRTDGSKSGRIRTLVSFWLIRETQVGIASRCVRQWERQIGHQSIVSIRASYHGVNTMGQSSSRYTRRCLRLFVRSMARRAYYAVWNAALWQK